MAFQAGVYLIRNTATSTVVDLSAGDSTNGTPAQGWEQHPFDHPFAYDQFWFVQPVPGAGTYTLSNLKSGTVLELSNGNSANGTQAQGWVRLTDPGDPAIHNQEWSFILVAASTYRLVNVRSGTALDLSNGGSANGTKLQGWEILEPDTNQHWFIERRTTPEGVV